jgi:hypothetical protein
VRKSKSTSSDTTWTFRTVRPGPQIRGNFFFGGAAAGLVGSRTDLFARATGDLQ